MKRVMGDDFWVEWCAVVIKKLVVGKSESGYEAETVGIQWWKARYEDTCLVADGITPLPRIGSISTSPLSIQSNKLQHPDQKQHT